MKKTLFIALALFCGSAMAEVKWENENLHYTDKDGNVTNDTTTYDKEGGVVTFNPGKTTISQNGSVSLQKDTEINVGSGQKVTYTDTAVGTGSVTKTGAGALEMRLNNSNTDTNNYFGSLTVDEGSFYLSAGSDSGVQANLGAEGNTPVHVIVDSDASLVLGERTAIRIPGGNKSTGTYSMIGAVQGPATISNVDICKSGVSAYDTSENKRGRIDGQDFICSSETDDYFKIKDVDIQSTDSSFTGRIELDNSTLSISSLTGLTSQSVEDAVILKNNSSIKHDGSSYAYVRNAIVDETSEITSATNSLELELMLMGNTTLSVSAKENGGLAARTITTGSGKTSIQYTTDQFSGDVLYIGDYYGSTSKLDVYLTDTDLTMNLVGVEFDLIVSNLILPGYEGDINDLVSLKIGHYDDTEWKDVVGNITAAYDGTTRNTTFSFKVERVVDVPEPATATLSLLALAGLCARRRRTAC